MSLSPAANAVKAGTSLPEIGLYSFPFRCRGERIKWVLSELQLPYTLHEVALADTRHPASVLCQLNAAGKVPVLTVDGAVYTESLAIMEYLAARFADRATLLPQTAGGLYRYRLVVSLLLTEIEAYLWTAEQASHIRPAEWPSGTFEAALEAAVQGVQAFVRHPVVSESLAALSARPDKATGIVEGTFGVADILAYHILTWVINLGLPLPEIIQPWLAMLQQRPAFPPSMDNRPVSL